MLRKLRPFQKCRADMESRYSGAMAKQHKKQHYVAATYLRPWVDPDCPMGHEPYVWRFDPDGSNARRKPPEKLFRETDMYTVTRDDGGRDLVLEHGPERS